MTMNLSRQPAASADHDVQEAAFNLRLRGYSSERIAATLGLPSGNVAYRAVHNFAARTGAQVPGAANRSAGATRGHQRRGTARQSRVTAPAVRNTGRRFGVEIEVVGISMDTAAVALRNAGIDANAESYNHQVRPTWKVTTDGSLRELGCEVVSPILSGASGFEAIRKVMAALTAAGARINRDCGLHVHHEVTDLNGGQLADLIEAFARQTRTMDALVAPSRRGSNATWCRPMSSTEVRRFAASFRATTGSQAEVRRQGIGGRPDSRYRSLNIHSFPTYGTFEFRQHQGTLNASKVIAWVEFGQALIDAAASGHANVGTVTGASFLTTLTEANLLPTTTGEFLTGRIATLA